MPMTILSPNHLLEQTILDFTIAATRAALEGVENQRKTASLALQFFVSLLDESNPAEKEKLTLFKDCLDALDDSGLCPGVLTRLGPCQPQSHSVLASTKPRTQFIRLSAMQQVLQLADLLEIILSFVDSIKTLHAMALVSRTIHRSAQARLWSYPLDLNTVELQVSFAFGASISGALSEPLGLHVKRLHIRRLLGGANDRLLVKIAQLCPHAKDVTLLWGDIGEDFDEAAAVTPELLFTLDSFLSTLLHCTTLSLLNYRYARFDFPPTFSPNAHVPFTRLRSLRIEGFSFYLPIIMRGVREGGVLRHLDIGMDTLDTFQEESMHGLALPELVSLRIFNEMDLEVLRGFVEGSPLLNDVAIYNDVNVHPGPEFITEVVSLFVSLPALCAFSHVLPPIEEVDLRLIAACACPIERLDLTIWVNVRVEGVDDALCELINAKRATLRELWIEFEPSEGYLSEDYTSEDLDLTYSFVPSVRLIESLSGCLALEKMRISCSRPPPDASAALDALLKNCPNLGFSPELEVLMRGHAMFETVFMSRIKGR
ncbi:hypothetical protein FISHEDRAFT_75754 [Fistulina hepatica ATCC 64428]|uniref:F-box domain-containing protein n=1 Tax=Fistulina hepatica ATCC 64428 TaxID=1128425 RepID=A0A0D7A6H6_9AGAR|nr:hypothetical protein FISHEDRAFT_75754 [Fistulina hepatica ATCC 64428]